MPVTNNTDIFPQPGFVLVEHIDHKSGKLIQVPEHLRKNGQAEFTTHDDFSLIVLEDGGSANHPALPPGTVAYMDPPYVGTTGYAADLPRAEVVALARRWAAAGAVVCVSEAEAIPDLVAEGWHAVRIDGERVGQRRTFSKQQAEWLTLNRAPAWTPSVQGALFGGAR